MHCELLVPGLFGAPAGVRLPALELLLARGRRTHDDAQSTERWLLAGFDLDLEATPAGALTLMAEGADHAEASWARADPVHLRLLRDRMIVIPAAAFSIARAEAEALCQTLNTHFSGRLQIRVEAPSRWVARLGEDLALPAAGPLEVAGRTVVAGPDADALLNEIQMALHEHPVNEAREARGEMPINSLWLWGAGRAPADARASWRSVTADEPIARGLARAARLPSRALAASGAHWLAHGPEDGRHLIVLDQLRAPLALSDEAGAAQGLQALEQEWFAPLLDALRSGRVGMITVAVPDGTSSLSVETIRGDLRRFWRRARPLAAWIG
jgi:hypothetical protein